MKHNDDKKKKEMEGPRRIFIPKARLLSQNEVGSLTEREKAFEKECKDKGLWLEIFCPGGSCAVTDSSKLP
jgi:hypothetical protein